MGQLLSNLIYPYLPGELVQWNVTVEQFEENGPKIERDIIVLLLQSTGMIQGHNPLTNQYQVKFENHTSFSVSATCLRPADPTFCSFRVGSIVRIINDEQQARSWQENHGGMSDGMVKCLGLVGFIRGCSAKSVVVVNGKNQWSWNPQCVAALSDEELQQFMEISKTTDPPFVKYDIVRIIDSKTQLQEMQTEEHGDWNDVMEKYLGSHAIVTSICDNNDVVLTVAQFTLRFHPSACVKLIPAHDCVPKKSEKSSFLKAFEAAKEGDLITLQSIISQYQINVKDRRLLAVACAENQVNVVEWLMESGSDVNEADDDGDCAIHVAVMRNRPNIATFLAKAGANVNAKNEKGFTPLHLAAKKGFLLAAVTLLKLGAICDEQDKIGGTPCHKAINKKHLEIAEKLIQHGHRPAIADNNGINILHLLTKVGSSGLISLLIQMHDLTALVNVRHPTGTTVLHIACANDHVSCLESLCSIASTDVNLRDHQGRSCLHLTVASRSMHCLQFLFHLLPPRLEQMMDINLPDSEGDTPLHLAVKMHIAQLTGNMSNITGQLYRQMIKPVLNQSNSFYRQAALMLIERGASILTMNDQNQTVLDVCVGDDDLLNALKGTVSNRSIVEEFSLYQNRDKPILTSKTMTMGDSDDATQSIETLNEELVNLKQKITCPICFMELLSTLFQCGHATCDSCAERLDKCPVCRVDIKERLPIRFL